MNPLLTALQPLSLSECIRIRNMYPGDWEQVKTIYQNGIATGIATFEESAPAWQRWDTEHLKFGRLVILKNNEIAGWAALGPVSDRCVYSGLAEVSIYISDKFRGKGIGRLLLNQLIKESEANGIWILQAGIISGNHASILLHKKAGFRSVGYREKLGKLNGEWKDVFILERRSKVVGID